MKSYMYVSILSLVTAIGISANRATAVVIEPKPNAPLQARFDTEEAERLLEPGSGSLRGKLEISIKKGMLKKNEKFVAQYQLVTLLPMSSYMRAWEKKYSKDPSLGMIFIDGRVLPFSARAITSADGSYEFRGLKPGRYLMIAKIPYKLDVVIRNETGQTRHDIDWFNNTITSSPIYKSSKARVEQEHNIFTIIEIKDAAETVFPQ
ncbi:carboxypeptidase-like regulatory domain-containing protein [Xanthomonas prunicola]|uniref:carboxypeptidase-like regulatory domain-containing protein n=1 Tax=Xanthomonas prunicola TaxID=2053930 RepID=UPI0021B34904|nr:carboxypeptidase-like regulatory domain-containing protein [Xanthomonas prunicola]UXA54404.1 carboxypeptidase-like regulatory domain-containing protein [Xanthomonas prunicola]UXA67965.1 carboxypeptidase-like regulatory domain-containing protein [Xanthomonas prunicola]